MVKIRLSRIGRKNLAHYRVVAVQAREKRDTNAIEQLGHYTPFTKELVLNEERIKYWLSVGAQPTETIARMFVREGLMDKSKLPVRTFKDKAGKQNSDRVATKAKKAEAAKAEKEKPAKVEAPVAEITETPAVVEPTAEVVEAPAADITETVAAK